MANCDVKTVCIELQRAGPPHNRLLSPLTRYLASSTDAEVGEVSVVDEHAQMLRKLRYLRVALDRSDPAQEERQLALQGLARDMSRFLAGVPGLQAQLTARGCDNELIHLQIVTSAAELSIESAGENPSSSLLLSGRPRVSLTRRVRSVSEGCVRWPLEPKVLFVAASPQRSIPFDQHLEAMLRALRPWIPPLRGPAGDHDGGREAHRSARKRVLHVLETASIDEIARACADEDFTHVHVLAHGAQNPNSPGRQFGIVLHGADKNTPHIVSGEQFATAMRREGGRGGPSVVTVAACDGAQVAEVLYTGASFLYDLHRSGVPLVVGSQFPLSKEGSVDLCEKLYEGMLRGKDPRDLLADLRLRLHSRYAERNHDWASLVAYAVFPSNLDRQLEELRYRQGRRALNVAIDYMDREVEALIAKARNAGGAAVTDDAEVTLPVQALQEINDRFVEAAALVSTQGLFRIDGLGLIGAHKKRLARTQFRTGQDKESFDSLQDSLRYYVRAFDEGVRYDEADEASVMAPLHWALTQEISLRLVLGLPDDFERLATARTIAEQDVDVQRSQAEVWSLTSLVEIELLVAWRSEADRARAIGKLQEWTKRLLRSPENGDAVYSTRRQLLRYVEWWWADRYKAALKQALQKDTHPVLPEVITAVNEVITEMADYLRVNETSVDRKR
jgi:CHAT domain